MGNTGKFTAIVMLVSVCCIAQQTHRRWLIAPKPPYTQYGTIGPASIWLDVISFTNQATGFNVTNWPDIGGSNFNVINTNVGMFTYTNSTQRAVANFSGLTFGMVTNDIQDFILGSNYGTVSLTIREFVTNTHNVFQSGSAPGNFVLVQVVNGVLRVYWGNSGVCFIDRGLPADWTSDVQNVVIVRTNAFMDVLCNTVSLGSTNNMTGLIYTNALGHSGDFTFPGQAYDHKYEAKRCMTWKYALSSIEISNLYVWNLNSP